MVVKTKNRIFAILAAGALAVTGCGQSGSKGPQPFVVNGVAIDLPGLQQAFPAGNLDLQTRADSAARAIRYGQFTNALAELNELAHQANLTGTQKKTVTAVTEQVKQLVNKLPVRPAQ